MNNLLTNTKMRSGIVSYFIFIVFFLYQNYLYGVKSAFRGL